MPRDPWGNEYKYTSPAPNGAPYEIISYGADGKPETRSVFLDHLSSPFGVALVGNDLYVANTDSIMRYPYKEGDTQIAATGTPLTPLPGGPIDHHWTKSLVASRDGNLLYVGVGSNSNVGENGMEAEKRVRRFPTNYG